MVTYNKYPRTSHLIWSPGVSEDDIIADTLSQFENNEVVVTVKLDGENSNLYRDHYHARSINSGHHPSRNWIKKLHASICSDIPENIRICGENMYATHSIHYKNLSTYFYVYSIWDNESNVCLSWNETIEWCSLLGLEHVPVLYRGVWNEELIKGLYQPTFEGNEMEGYVVRLASSFKYEDFQKSMAKFVRKNHVQTDRHWMKQKIVPNELKT